MNHNHRQWLYKKILYLQSVDNEWPANIKSGEASIQSQRRVKD